MRAAKRVRGSQKATGLRPKVLLETISQTYPVLQRMITEVKFSIMHGMRHKMCALQFLKVGTTRNRFFVPTYCTKGVMFSVKTYFFLLLILHFVPYFISARVIYLVSFCLIGCGILMDQIHDTELFLNLRKYILN